MERKSFPPIEEADGDDWPLTGLAPTTRSMPAPGILIQRVPISRWLAALLSVLSLVLLDNVTAGRNETCSWSLFGIWSDKIRYILTSPSPGYWIGDLFTGWHNRGFWLYTFVHVVVAVILGWASAAVIGAARLLWNRRGPS